LTALVRQLLDAERKRGLDGRGAPADPDRLAARVGGRARRAGVFSLRPVSNATGVVLHTTLGRALGSCLAWERLGAGGRAYATPGGAVGPACARAGRRTGRTFTTTRRRSGRTRRSS